MTRAAAELGFASSVRVDVGWERDRIGYSSPRAQHAVTSACWVKGRKEMRGEGRLTLCPGCPAAELQGRRT